MTELNLLHYNKGTLVNMIKELEEENESFRKLKERYQLEKETYKSRIDKAIELINKRKNEIEDLWIEMKADDYCEEYDEILNILQGEDNE